MSNWSWRHFCHARGFRFLQITPRLSWLFHRPLIRWLAPCMGTAAAGGGTRGTTGGIGTGGVGQGTGTGSTTGS